MALIEHPILIGNSIPNIIIVLNNSENHVVTFAAIEFHPHRYVCMPSQWSKTNVTR